MPCSSSNWWNSRWLVVFQIVWASCTITFLIIYIQKKVEWNLKACFFFLGPVSSTCSSKLNEADEWHTSSRLICTCSPHLCVELPDTTTFHTETEKHPLNLYHSENWELNRRNRFSRRKTGRHLRKFVVLAGMEEN